jgi:hypothetical protein
MLVAGQLIKTILHTTVHAAAPMEDEPTGGLFESGEVAIGMYA